MSKLPTDYASEVDSKKPNDTGESQPLKDPKARNSSGNAWHGFKKPSKK